MAVALPAAEDWEVREDDGEPVRDGRGRLVGDGDAGLCWLGSALGLPVDADGVAEPLADAELLADVELLADAELLAGGAGEGVDETVEAEVDGCMIVGSGEGDADAVAETGTAWH